MTTLIVAVTGTAILTLIGVLARPWLIENGWIFGPDRDAKGMGTATANALGQIEALFQPSVEHVLEWRQHEEAWILASQPVAADDPDPDSDPGPGFRSSL